MEAHNQDVRIKDYCLRLLHSVRPKADYLPKRPDLESYLKVRQVMIMVSDSFCAADPIDAV
jgi:hypothetical protein